ncbi:type II toxin-antitoxin system HicA family toxin [Candidatus Harpocratesius sp.]
MKWLKSLGFKETRQKGSHLQIRKKDLRTTVPVHKCDLPHGTIRKILKDLEISVKFYEKNI